MFRYLKFSKKNQKKINNLVAIIIYCIDNKINLFKYYK